MDRLLTAYQEDLLSLDELRRRMPDLRQREQSLQGELQALRDRTAEEAAMLRLSETLTSFLKRLRKTAESLDIAGRQKILRLLVKEVLVDKDSITIRHSIPIPRGLGDEVMQGLVGCLDMPRIEAGGHRLDALALARQQQAGAIAAQRSDPVGVTDLLAKSAYVSLEPDLTSDIGRNRRNRRRLDHAILYGYQLGFYNRICDTVRLVTCQSSGTFALSGIEGDPMPFIHIRLASPNLIASERVRHLQAEVTRLVVTALRKKAEL